MKRFLFSIVLIASFALTFASKVQVTFKILATQSEVEKSSEQAAYDLKNLLSTNSFVSPHEVVNWTVHSDWIPSVTTGMDGVDSENNDSFHAKPSILTMVILAIFSLFSIKFSRTILAVFVVLLVINNQIFVKALNGYENCKILDEESNYKLYWTVTGNSIRFGMQASVTGYAALGFSSDGTMNSGGAAPGSDIVMGYVNTGVCQKGCINDYSTTSYSKPLLDTVQNIRCINGSEANGVLTLEWSRDLHTGDVTNDRDIMLNQNTNVIWSLQTTTKPLSNDTFAKHDKRNPVVINFSNPSQCPGDPSDVLVELLLNTSMAEFDQSGLVSSLSSQLGISSSRIAILSTQEIEDPFVCPECTILDFKFKNFSVPTTETTYACLGFTFSTSTQTQIIRMEPILDNRVVLHHMILFLTANPYPSTPVTDCEMPTGATAIYVWAPGGQPLNMPDNVGFTVGGSSNVWYAAIQMHYTNPTYQADIRL